MTADEVLANLPIREADRMQGLYAKEEAEIRLAFAVLAEVERLRDTFLIAQTQPRRPKALYRGGPFVVCHEQVGDLCLLLETILLRATAATSPVVRAMEETVTKGEAD